MLNSPEENFIHTEEINKLIKEMKIATLLKRKCYKIRRKLFRSKKFYNSIHLDKHNGGNKILNIH